MNSSSPGRSIDKAIIVREQSMSCNTRSEKSSTAPWQDENLANRIQLGA